MNVELLSQFFQGRSDSADQSMSPSVEFFSILQVYVTVSLSIAYLYPILPVASCQFEAFMQCVLCKTDSANSEFRQAKNRA